MYLNSNPSRHLKNASSDDVSEPKEKEFIAAYIDSDGFSSSEENNSTSFEELEILSDEDLKHTVRTAFSKKKFDLKSATMVFLTVSSKRILRIKEQQDVYDSLQEKKQMLDITEIQSSNL